MINRLGICLFCLPLALAAGPVLAHSDSEPPLYVAEEGVDSGSCQDAAQPCRSIRYAVSRLGKGGEVRVASGSYDVSDADTVFHLVNGSVAISGGFSRDGGFRRQGPSPSTLHGVPTDFAEALSDRGFHVIADSKGLDAGLLAQTSRNLAIHEALKSSLPATPCVSGSAAGMACLDVDLLAHVGSADISARPDNAADVWGFVDLNTNREYAIVGFDIGTAVFDVTDPTVPREVGFINGRSTSWRDIKVYQFYDPASDRWQAYAYISTDGTTDGLFVIDLGGLPHGVSRVAYTGDFSAAHNVFITGTDHGTGLVRGTAAPNLVVAGSNSGSGPYRAYTLGNASAPAFSVMPGAGRSDYSHDVASAAIGDARKDSQCVDAAAPWCELLFDFNELSFDIWDVTNPSAPARLSRSSYPGVAYVHSGWPSEDNRYLFVHDELDERNFGLDTTLRVYDLADLGAPAHAGSWTGPTNAIDHNGFVRGNRYYMSNYSRGLTVLDITDPRIPRLVGHFDTFPGSDALGFVGAWGTYPYFHSGNIAISDIDTGLYMVADRSIDVAEGRLAFAADAFGGIEGGTTELVVERLGGVSGAVSVTYEIIPATGRATDLGTVSGELAWDDGDAMPKSITVELVADGLIEPVEQFLVRLLAPAGGATIGARPVASLYVSEPGEQSFVAFEESAIAVAEQGFATAVAVIHRSGSATGAASVDFAVAGGTATAGIDFNGPTAGTLTWADGDAGPRWVEFAIVDDGQQELTESFEVSLGNAAGAMLGAKSVLQVSITGGGGNPPPPPDPPRKRSGGSGSADWLLLFALVPSLRRRVIRRGAA